jgi:hypothetical protein
VTLSYITYHRTDYRGHALTRALMT